MILHCSSGNSKLDSRNCQGFPRVFKLSRILELILQVLQGVILDKKLNKFEHLQSAVEDHVRWMKAPDQLLNGPCGFLFLSKNF